MNYRVSMVKAAVTLGEMSDPLVNARDVLPR
jgi:hypothetical protein